MDEYINIEVQVQGILFLLYPGLPPPMHWPTNHNWKFKVHNDAILALYVAISVPMMQFQLSVSHWDFIGGFSLKFTLGLF